jgi:hypothetical protein
VQPVGDSSTRCARTVRLASRVRPARSNSLTSGAKFVPVALICSNRLAGLKFTTKSCVVSMLRSVSFAPTEVNMMIGGVTDATVKKECGARLSTPSAETLETQAIGRGTMTEVSRR